MRDPGRTAARLILGAVLLWAAAGKIAHPLAFFNALLDYELPLPETVLRAAAVILPWLETICGAALVLAIWPETVRPLAAALCAGFVLALGQAVIRGLDLRCGCFGSGHSWMDRPAVALARAGALLALSLYLLAPPGKSRRTS